MVMTGFRLREGCIGWESIWPRNVVHGYDWLSMEGRLYMMGRRYVPGTFYLGAD